MQEHFSGMSDTEAAYTVASDNDEVVEQPSPDRDTNTNADAAVGIDIGTLQIRASVWQHGRIEALQNHRGLRAMPAYVLFHDADSGGGPCSGVGAEVAVDEERLLSGAAVFNIKRLIGRLDTDPAVQAASRQLPFVVQTMGIGVRPFIAALMGNGVWRSTTAEEALAVLLVELRAMAEVRLRRRVRSVVLTVPVAFSRFQQTRVERACAMAGLHVLRVMPEPTAVALLYAQQQQMASQANMGSGTEKVALIFNMGAGYCDVCVAATAGGVSQIKALAGLPVGGEDILQNTITQIASEVIVDDTGLRTPEAIRACANLRSATQKAIHALSTQTQTTITADLDLKKISKTLFRHDFEAANAEIFERCGRLVSRCLSDAQVDPDSLDDVVLVGGCAQIPRLRSLVLGLCRKTAAYDGIRASDGAVSGAALEGAIAAGVTDHPALELLTIQVTPLSLGVRVGASEFVPVIRRNSTIPARREAVFTTSYENQAEAAIIVYEGEGEGEGEGEDEQEVAGKNHVLGFFKLSGIPAASKGVPLINVCMDVDASNVLRVFAGVTMPGSETPAVSFMEVRMPTVDDSYGWCVEAFQNKYGSSLDIAVPPKAFSAPAAAE